MATFGFLKEKKEYALFSTAAMEVERAYESSSAMSNGLIIAAEKTIGSENLMKF